MTTLPDKPTELASLLAISVPYASQLLSSARPWPRTLAIAAYRKTGVKLGPIADASDADIDVLERFETRSPTTPAAADARSAA
jgi:hypothetical protein